MKADLETLKQKNSELEARNCELDKANKALKKDVDKKSKSLKEFQNRQQENEITFETMEDINEKLIGDINALNDKMLELVPHAIIQENEELKETLNVLHNVIDVYKQAEIDAEEDSENGAASDFKQLANQNHFQCRICPFRSESNRELSVHIARKHYQQQGKENFNLINLWSEQNVSSCLIGPVLAGPINVKNVV